VRNLLQKACGLKKLKVGHAGTLDPLATGLLVLCTGKATKLIASLTADDKAYTGTLRLGSTTPSYDLETEINQTLPTGHITPQMVAQAAQSLTGPIMQVPPGYSAKWVDGKRAYLAARKGEEVALSPVPVVVHTFATDCADLPDVHFEIHCAKGTYVRSLVRDLGEALACGAHLTALCRTASGSFRLSDALTIEKLSARLQNLS
jgi:tRNA pseudouridine55 synthase